MSWRAIVEPEMINWPQAERARVLAELSHDNDTAERLGFVCHLDDRLGYGQCLFVSQDEKIRVWLSPHGWCRAECRGIAGMYQHHKYYHTATQALRGEHPRAIMSQYGVLTPLSPKQV